MEYRNNTDSILVNKMLEDAIGLLLPSEHPLVHTEDVIIDGRMDRTYAAGLTRSMSKKDVHRTMQLVKDFFRRLKKRVLCGRSW